MFSDLLSLHSGAGFCKAGRLIAGLDPESAANLRRALARSTFELETSVIHRSINTELGRGTIGVSVLARHRQHICSCPTTPR